MRAPKELSQPKNRLIHLIPGISACGKTEVARYTAELLKAGGINAQVIVPHTTRPMRECEQEGVDYHFHSMEEFESKYLPLCNKPGSLWVASEIGGHWYFNTSEATAPTDICPVKILPVAFSAFEGVVAEHEGRGYAVTAIPIAITNETKKLWLATTGDLRPTRDLERELNLQKNFIRNYRGEIFYPKWNSKSQDFAEYYRIVYRQVIELGHVACDPIFVR